MTLVSHLTPWYFVPQLVIWLRLEVPARCPVAMDYVCLQARAAVSMAGQGRPATRVSMQAVIPTYSY